jgi:hypothetical protein
MIYVDTAGTSLPVGEITKIETWSFVSLQRVPIEPGAVYRLRASGDGVKFRLPYKGDVLPSSVNEYTMKADEIIYFYSGESDFIQVNTGATDSIYVIVYK